MRARDTEALYSEATIFGKYLVGDTPPQDALELYAAANASKKVQAAADQRLLSFIHRNPWSVGMIDGGLNIVNRQSEVRRRIYVMFSILETRPEHHEKFLSKERGHVYLLSVLFIGAFGLVKSLLGIALVKVVGK